MEHQDHASMLRKSNADSDFLDLEIKQMEEEVISMNNVLIPSPDMTNNYHQNENETHYPLQVEPSLPRALIFDTKDLT